VWEYENPYLHHDFYRMDNGNTMVITWVRTPDEVAARVKGGVQGSEREGVMWSDALCEMDTSGEVVWEWRSHQYLEPNVDMICPIFSRDRWGQANSVCVMPDGNILLSFGYTDLIAIVDRKTDKIIWRWGGIGMLGMQHNVTVLDNGNSLVFDNGRYRPRAPDYTRVIEVNPKTNEVEWEYVDNPPQCFYASLIGGAQRLSNGNTLICDGPVGRFFEIDSRGEIVWEYVNPFYYDTSRFGRTNMTFRAYRYSPDFPGLKGTGLEDVNLIYGPEETCSYRLRTQGLHAVAQPDPLEVKEKMPSVGKQEKNNEKGGRKVLERLKLLGY
jgi:hypothetical protein